MQQSGRGAGRLTREGTPPNAHASTNAAGRKRPGRAETFGATPALEFLSLLRITSAAAASVRAPRGVAFRSAALRSEAFASDGPCRCCSLEGEAPGSVAFKRSIDARARPCEEKLFWKRAARVPQIHYRSRILGA